MTTTQELLESSFELNLSNYGPEDVERLNDWAIKAHNALEPLQAERNAAADNAICLAFKVNDLEAERDAALARLAELEISNAELERLCDATYVAQGADAYNHACECMEAFQEKRRATGKEVGTTHSLCDGMGWVYHRLDELEAAGASPVEPSQAVELSDEEQVALLRFDETCEDGQGYDVKTSMMSRLAEIGVVSRKFGSVYFVTEYGQRVIAAINAKGSAT